MPPVLLRHPSSLDHDTGPGHPERADRVRAIEAEMDACDWLGWEVRESVPATREQLLGVHPAAHVDRLQELSASGGGWIDSDTVVSPGTWTAALHGSGGVCEAVDVALAGGGPGLAASVHRPPGHHATADWAMGFCFFNHVAVGAQWARDRHGVERVAIVDWDVHHGNGTNDVFHARDDVLFVSIHESPLYPGTGPASDVGSGAGRGFTVNLPVPGGSGDEVFVSMVQGLVVPLLREFDPGLLLVSAGFDAHLDDPLAGCAVTDEGYRAMAASLAALGRPTVVVLEGGYELGALARGLRESLTGFASGEAAAELPEHALVGRARDRLVKSWPGLVA